MKIWLWPTVLLALMIATGAHAGSVEDGNAGLEALNSGSYDKAISLFTRAIKRGDMATDDREFAYFNRGQAYIGKGNYKNAVADFKTAVRLKPDDADAQNSLKLALAGPQAGGAPAKEVQAAPSPNSDPWGVFSRLAGQYYWYPVTGQDPQFAYLHYEWTTPQQILSYSVSDKKGRLYSIGEYELDQKTGKLMEAQRVSDKIVYATAEASADNIIEYFFVDGNPTKTTEKLLDNGSVIQTVQNYSDNSWKDSGISRTEVEVPKETLQAQGYLKK